MGRRLLCPPVGLVDIVAADVPPPPDWVCVYWPAETLEMRAWVEYTAESATAWLSSAPITMPAGDGPTTNRSASIDASDWPNVWWVALIGGVIVAVELRTGTALQIEAQLGTIEQPYAEAGMVHWVESLAGDVVLFSAALPEGTPVEGDTFAGATMRGWIYSPGGLAAAMDQGGDVVLSSGDPAGFTVTLGSGGAGVTRFPGAHSGEDVGGPTYVSVGNFGSGLGFGDQLRNPGGEGFVYIRDAGPAVGGDVAAEIADADALGCSVRPYGVVMFAYPFTGPGVGAWLSHEGPGAPENSSAAVMASLINHEDLQPDQAFPVEAELPVF
jgi:hypothetical protein